MIIIENEIKFAKKSTLVFEIQTGKMLLVPNSLFYIMKNIL